jgi:geranylgeranyl diphosphate synthase type II
MTGEPEYRVLFAAQLREIEVCLERYLVQSDTPDRLLAAMRYSLLAPGKRIRALLTLLVCHVCGRIWEWALPAACAVEMVHAYSLIHDDLPAMDDDDFRRGQPSCHKQFNEATAILAGDALLTLAFETLALRVQPDVVAVRCVAELAQAAGMAGMVGGQMDDLTQEQSVAADLATLESIHRRKTGLLLRAAARLGGAIGLYRSPQEEEAAKLHAITEYATQLGLAFQIADDLLDVQSDAATMGKATQKDAQRGKLTYPGLLGVEGARAQLLRAYEQGMAALETFGPSAQSLGFLLKYVVERSR